MSKMKRNGTGAEVMEKPSRISRMNGTAGADKAQVSITAPDFRVAEFTIEGDSPYVQLRFGEKAMGMMREKQAAGSVANKGKKRSAKDFDQCYRDAMHKSKQGWCGIPAPAFRNAMISACRMAGFKMTIAKMSTFCEADGFDAVDGTPLVKITKGEPHYCEHAVRNATGVADIRPRAMWDPGWQAVVRIRFDADQFTPTDVANLMMRAGVNVGIGEGRPDSKNSNGMGWGLFHIVEGKKRK